MPLSKLHVPHHLDLNVARDIGELLHISLVETCGVRDDDNFYLITRYQDGEMIAHPNFLGQRDPKATIVIEITLLAGRTDAQKEALYGDVRTRLKSTSVDPENVIIFLVENNPIDFSFSGAGSVKSVLGL